MEVYDRSIAVHRDNHGKLGMHSTVPLESIEDMSLAYTPGVAGPCLEIARNPEAVWDLSWKGRVVAVVSDGSAVLGLGNIGPAAALPVMEGKAILFREFGGIDAVPVVLDTQDPDEIVRIVTAMAPSFGGINLEDISAPRCFAIEEALQDIGIPVLHDDQHGTAIVLLSAMINAAKVLGKPLPDLSVVVNGAGAAGRAIARLLCHCDATSPGVAVGRVRICDTKGIIAPGRAGNTAIKEELGALTNPEGSEGSLSDALRGADVFIGVSRGGILRAGHVRTMAADPIIFAMANPTPEIMPDEAQAGGAAIVGTGRSDFPNQVNNVLAFPGLFRGALKARARSFSVGMKWAAIEAIVAATGEASPSHVLPEVFDRSLPMIIGDRVAEAAVRDGVADAPVVEAVPN